MNIFKKLFTRKHEGASKTKRTSNWRTTSGDANYISKFDLETLRNRSRDLRRNVPYAKKAIEVVTSGVIGTGIVTKITGPNNKIIEEDFREWVETSKIDYDGQLNIYGLQKIIMDAIQESGECIIRKRYVNDEKHIIQYQVLESDFLNNNLLDGVSANGNRIIQGVEFNDDGKIVGYHLYKNHPGSFNLASTFETNFIPAEDVIHLYRKDRPGQVRGIPWSSANIIRIKDLYDFQDAQLMRQKIAACFSGFVHDISSDCDNPDDSDFGQTIEPGSIEELPPGKTITFASPPPAENYKEFISVELHAIAAGYGISYESLTNDLSEINFSSARMGWLEMNRNFEAWRQNLIIFGFLNVVWSDYKKAKEITGDMKISDRNKAKHISPKREMIDPTKEVPASIKKMRAGLSSLTDEIISLGKDPEDVFNQMKADQDLSEKLGLILDSNPKYTNSAGSKNDNGNDQNNIEDNSEDEE